MSDQRPYATLHAKGADRRQRILAVAQRLLTRHGWRRTTLGQIAKDAGVSTAGVLHHFESKEQILHAVIDARDSDDFAHANLAGDVVEQIGKVPDRYRRAPDLVGMYSVLLIENLEPDAPLHDRLLERHRSALEMVADGIRRGQRAGRYRADVEPAVKAVEILAFLNGMETTWLLDPSIPLSKVFAEYTRSLAAQLAPPG